MKFLDPAAENYHYEHEIEAAFRRVMGSGQYLFGEELKKLENNMAHMTAKAWGVGVKNATDGIQLVLKYLWKPGTFVVLPNFGAYPTSVAVHNVVPKEWIWYVDVDRSMTIDPSKLPLWMKKCIVIGVNLFGNDCDVHALANYCVDRGPLVMDCAQSTGSATTCWGGYSIYSFYPSKPLASMGDGGMIVGNDVFAEVYLRSARFYGQDGRKSVVFKGGVNSRMDEIQAAIVNAKFDTFHTLTLERRIIANRYLRIVNGIDWRPGAVFHVFPLLFRDREKVIREMDSRKIPYIIHYPEHVSEMPALPGQNWTVSYRVSDKILSVPCHAFMSEDEIQRVEEFLYAVRDFEV